MDMEHSVYTAKWIFGVAARQRIIHPLIIGEKPVLVVTGLE